MFGGIYFGIYVVCGCRLDMFCIEKLGIGYSLAFLFLCGYVFVDVVRCGVGVFLVFILELFEIYFLRFLVLSILNLDVLFFWVNFDGLGEKRVI